MKIYNYNKKTKEFMGSSDARMNPLEPNEVLIPLNATKISPPIYSRGEIPVFDEDLQKWEIVNDSRGLKIYSKTSSDETVHKALGNLPEGYTIVPRKSLEYKWDENTSKWVHDLNIIKKNKIRLLLNTVRKEQYSPIEYKNKIFLGTDDAQLKIFGLLATFNSDAELPQDFFVFGENYTPIEINYNELKELSVMFLNRSHQLNTDFGYKVKRINESRTKSEVSGIN